MMDAQLGFGRSVRACVIGASGGIGGAVVDGLQQSYDLAALYKFSRSDFDIIDEGAVQSAAKSIGCDIDVLIIATGFLSGGCIAPEKSLRQVNYEGMLKAYEVNAIAPALILKHFSRLLPRDRRSVALALSARVGSISDNQKGGWYGYRASKAALNMVIKSAAIELSRTHPHAILYGYHPGTVHTPLSAPFSGSVRHDIFYPDQAAGYLLDVLRGVDGRCHGQLVDWRGDVVQP